ncbi:MAG: EAL domain-containing protein [Lachnospiraceae bacterium]|nr:EAL domain-containing protein [Lachnospiraceae bacterium]
MDFQAAVDAMSAMTCLVSVERKPDGGYGKIRIVTGNKAYIDSIEHPAPGTEMLTYRFVPNSEYTDYLTRDLNFEDFCYRSAVEKKCLHSYAHPDRMDVWFNMTFLPVFEDTEDLSYCLYIMQIDLVANPENMTNMSSDISAAVLDTCIRLRGTNDFNASMKDVIAGIRKLCDAEFCCVLIVNEFERSCSVLCESIREGSHLASMEKYINDDFYDIAESWAGTIAGSNCLIAKNAHDMEIVKERNPVWYESLTSAGTKNIVLFPLKSRNQLLGYMWALNFDPERSVKIKEALEITTFIVGSELGNHLLLDRLTLIGTKDMLTGVLNRNEMNNFVDNLSHGSMSDVSVGVIFADLNGLKTVNDEEGHNAGDLLLKNAASVLREVFSENEIYRAGGDEFAVIVTDVTEEDIEGQIEKVREESKKYGNVSFAIGGCVETNSSNVRMALRRADEKMYADKERYYKENPELSAEVRRSRAPAGQSEDQIRHTNKFRELNFDFLTGLPSMTYFFRLADAGRRKMHEEGIESVLLFVNMSGLKFYNKRYGFSEGDALIKELARVLSAQFGEENCSRFGQDHFGVFTEAKDIEKKIKTVFREMKTANSGRTLPVRAGIYPDSMGVVETSLACDRAQFACESGRDDNISYFRYFDKAMLDLELNRQYVVENLDRAIAENWITAYYQPIIRATSRKVCDEEALARWIDPEKGMMSPADFIPILEDTRLIYKVDLHIVDIILERIKNQMASDHSGIQCVPISVNLSRTDFECCDIVEEICNRVDAAGVPRGLLTIEITESVIGENFEFMKEQIRRFQELGFRVWMDDFGSGYSSLDLLQEMQFDLIKFDMRFMRQFEKSPRSRIILTELMRMAVSLNIDTVCEGVETEEQVEFLSGIGCTRMQGYYFCKPISAEELHRRIVSGMEIGFEDRKEADYHRLISSVSLYSLDAVTSEDSESIRHYYDTFPMVLFEYNGKGLRLIRCNKAYREFEKRYSIVVDSYVSYVQQCEAVGQRVFATDETDDGETVNSMIRKIADNPLSGAGAYMAAVLNITEKSEEALTYTAVARALSVDYIDLYQVDLKTNHFTQYSADSDNSGITVERTGDDFFETSHRDIRRYIYEDDQDAMIESLTNENVRHSLNDHGAFTITYRLMTDDGAQYVNMKAVRMGEDDNNIIIAVYNIDAQKRQEETLERLQEETTTYSRISVLMGSFLAIYTVDPKSGNYMEYSSSGEYAEMGTPRAGIDFFEDSRAEIVKGIVPEDLDHFLDHFTREKVLETTSKGAVFKLKYRLILAGEPVMITLRAGIVNEKDGPQLIVGVLRSDG